MAKFLFEYTSLYWLRDTLTGDGLQGWGRVARAYLQYPGLLLSRGLKWLSGAVGDCSISILNKGINIGFYDSAYAVPIAEMGYPGAELGLVRAGAISKANLFGLKINLSESPLFLRSLFSAIVANVYELLSSTQWKVYADTTKKIRSTRMLKPAVKRTLKKSGSERFKKKVTFDRGQQSKEVATPKFQPSEKCRSPAPEKEVEELDPSVPSGVRKEIANIKAALKGEALPREAGENTCSSEKEVVPTTSLSKFAPEKSATPKTVEEAARKKGLVVGSETKVTDHLMKKPDDPSGTPHRPNSRQGKAVAKFPATKMGANKKQGESIERAVFTEGEDSKDTPKAAPRPSTVQKQKEMKPVGMGSVYAKMKALHQKRKDAPALGGSSRDLGRFGGRPKK